MTKPTFAQTVRTLKKYTKPQLKKYFDTVIKNGKGKGVRGWALEELVGVKKTSDLNDLADGELKTANKGGHLNLTSLAHTLPEVFDTTPFEKTMFYQKIRKSIYCFFDKKTGEFDSIRAIDLDKLPALKAAIEEDYLAICDYIEDCYWTREELSGKFRAPNNLLFLGTSGYGDITFEGRTLSTKYYRAWGLKRILLDRVIEEGTLVQSVN